MDNPLISIIIPVYKVEEYLRRCVESVMKQTYQNIEIILVDDGSPDRCGEICDELAQEDQRIRVMHKVNGGLSDARNKGSAIATGEYIFFLDSDDFIALDTIEYLYQLLLDSGADISVCGMERTTSDYAEFKTNPKNPGSLVISGEEAAEAAFTHRYDVNMVTATGKLLPTALVRKLPFPVGKIHEDTATVPKYLFESGKVVLGNKACYAYYSRPDSIMGNVSTGAKKNDDCTWVYRYIADYFETNHCMKLANTALIELYYILIADSMENQGRSNRDLKALAKETQIPAKFKCYISAYLLFPRTFCFLMKKRNAVGN